MELTLYTFRKRTNSTSQPTGGTVIQNITLKQPTSVISPTFILSRSNWNNTYNYVKWVNDSGYVPPDDPTPDDPTEDITVERNGDIYFKNPTIDDYTQYTVNEIASSYSVGLTAANVYNVYCIPIKTSAPLADGTLQLSLGFHRVDGQTVPLNFAISTTLKSTAYLQTSTQTPNDSGYVAGILQDINTGANASVQNTINIDIPTNSITPTWQDNYYLYYVYVWAGTSDTNVASQAYLDSIHSLTHYPEGVTPGEPDDPTPDDPAVVTTTRYYFISNVTYLTNDLVQIDCTEDCLATYKSAISNTTQYVLRAAGSYDGTIPDTMAITTSQPEVKKSFASSPLFQSTPYCYIVGLANTSTSETKKRGTVSYLAFTDTMLARLIQYMNTFDATAETAGMKPFDYIASVTAIYTNIASALTLVSGNIKFNNSWSIQDISYFTINKDLIITSTGTLSLPHHPQLNSTTKQYLDYEPYSNYQLLAGPFGSINIDRRIFNTWINYGVIVDVITGDAILYLRDSVMNTPSSIQDAITNSAHIAHASCGVNVQISGQGFNPQGGGVASFAKSQANWQMVGEFVSTAANTASILALAGNSDNGISRGSAIAAGVSAVSGITSSILTNIATDRKIDFNAAAEPLMTLGTNGSPSAIISSYLVLIAHFVREVSDANRKFGYPLHKYIALNKLSAGTTRTTGYIKCGSNDIYIQGALLPEQQVIRTHMLEGFYLN